MAYKESANGLKNLAEVTKEWLETKYITEGLGVYEIKQMLKIHDPKLISAKLDEFRIPKKKDQKAVKQEIINPETGEVIVVKVKKESPIKPPVKKEVKEIILSGKSYEVGERFYLTQDLLKGGQVSLKKDQLVEVESLNEEKGLIKIKDVYTHMVHEWVIPAMLWWPEEIVETPQVEEIPVEGEQNASNI